MASVSPQGFALKSRLKDGLDFIKTFISESAMSSGAAIALLALAVSLVVVLFLWSTNTAFVPLYGNQQSYEASEIINVLDQEQIPYQLHPQTGQVLVGKDTVALARLKLASQGVSERMPTGIESLDKLSEITTSQFMESSRYTHAIEGELAKTIMTINGVSRARVHLAIPERTLFVGRKEQTPTASVVLDLTRSISGDQVNAISNLVAGSITGMNPNSVQIVDQRGNLLSSSVDNDPLVGSGNRQMEYTAKIEGKISQRAQDMLTPILGKNNFRVQVSADIDFSQIEETREQLEGQPVMVQETTVTDSSMDAGAMGIPGALSNRPPAPPGAEEEEDPEAMGAVVTRDEASRKFDTSRSVRKVRFGDSRLKTISLAVLINQKAGDETWTEEELQTISESVQTAAGIDADRGDQFTLQVATFMPPEAVEMPEPSLMDMVVEYEEAIKNLAAFILIALIILVVVRPLVKSLTSGKSGDSEAVYGAEPEPAPKAEKEKAEGDSESEKPVYRDEADAILAQIQSGGISDDSDSMMSIISMSLPEPGSPLEEQIAHLKLLSEKETVRVSEIIKTWINGSENKG